MFLGCILLHIDAHPSLSPGAAAVSPRDHRVVGFLGDFCTLPDSCRIFGQWHASSFVMSSGIWQLSSGTPYTSAADFSADASRLSGEGG
jgi:hypothetical protein